MKYIPNREVEEDRFNPENIPVAETTKFMRWGTQIEQDDIVNQDFIKRHPTLFASVNKWLPLANFQKDHKQKQIERIRRMNISLMESCGLDFDAEETVIDTIGDAQYSRGENGFYTKELNTQREKIRQEVDTGQKKKSWRDGFKTKKQPEGGEVNW